MKQEILKFLKEELNGLDKKTIGIYGYMSSFYRTYSEFEKTEEIFRGNQILKARVSFYPMMKLLDEYTIHGLQEVNIPKFLYVGASELNSDEYENYIRLLNKYCIVQKNNYLEKMSLYWFHSVCKEVYEEKNKNQGIDPEKTFKKMYMDIMFMDESKKIEKNEI